MNTSVQAPVTFPLNPQAVVTERYMGRARSKVVIVDNFYEDPNLLRRIADRVVYSDDAEITFDFPGERALVAADTENLLAEVCRLYGKVDALAHRVLPLTFSRSRSDTVLHPGQRQPHTDPALIAMVYLNRPEECAGGTAFYRHRGTGLDWIPFEPDTRVVQLARSLNYNPSTWSNPAEFMALTGQIFFHPDFAAPDSEAINDGNQYWERLDLVEMKWNRLVIFDGRIPHSEYTHADDFQDTHRLVQMLSVPLDAKATASTAASRTHLFPTGGTSAQK